MFLRLPHYSFYRVFHAPLRKTLVPPRDRLYLNFTGLRAFKSTSNNAVAFSPSVQLEEVREADATKKANHEVDISNTDTAPQHAVVSTFDLLSIGIGPSSSHTGKRLGGSIMSSLPF